MATTPVYLIPYPVSTDKVIDGENAMQAIAERVEALLGVWKTWTPTLTGFTLLSPVYRWAQIGKTVHARWSGTIGITTGGPLIVTLPAPTASPVNAVIGDVFAIKVAGNVNNVGAAVVSTANQVYFASHASTVAWSNSAPVTWAGNDPIGGRFTYETSGPAGVLLPAPEPPGATTEPCEHGQVDHDCQPEVTPHA